MHIARSMSTSSRSSAMGRQARPAPERPEARATVPVRGPDRGPRLAGRPPGRGGGGRRPLVPRRPFRARRLPGRPPSRRRLGRPRDGARRPAAAADGRHPLPDPGRFAAGLGAAGIGDGQPVVAYDDLGGMAAGRLVWLLRIAGRARGPARRRARVPGPARWRRATAPPPGPPDDATLAADGPGQRPSTTADAGSARGPGVVLDARAPERYRGEVEPIDARAGHIPGARNAPFAANLDPTTGRFRPRPSCGNASKPSGSGPTAARSSSTAARGSAPATTCWPSSTPASTRPGPASTPARGRSGRPTRAGRSPPATADGGLTRYVPGRGER